MEAYITDAAGRGLMLVLILSAPPVLAALIVGLMVSLLQATTQVQEQTLTFVPKLVAVMVTLVLFGPMGMAKMQEYTSYLMTSFVTFIK